MQKGFICRRSCQSTFKKPSLDSAEETALAVLVVLVVFAIVAAGFALRRSVAIKYRLDELLDNEYDKCNISL